MVGCVSASASALYSFTAVCLARSAAQLLRARAAAARFVRFRLIRSRAREPPFSRSACARLRRSNSVDAEQFSYRLRHVAGARVTVNFTASVDAILKLLQR